MGGDTLTGIVNVLRWQTGVSAQSHCRKGEFQTERARGFMEQFREPPSRELLPPRRHLKQGPARPEHRG